METKPSELVLESSGPTHRRESQESRRCSEVLVSDDEVEDECNTSATRVQLEGGMETKSSELVLESSGPRHRRESQEIRRCSE
eukprot:1192441-Prorocentrum_minimum.AAC.1